MFGSVSRAPFIITCWFFLLQTDCAYAIVSMDDLHFGTKELGVSGSLSLGLSGSSGNSDKSQVNLDATGAHRVDGYSNIVIGNYQYGESNAIRNTNSAFLHARHIRDSQDPGRDWETFAQMERNEFTRLKLRSLAGAGVRYSYRNEQDVVENILGYGAFFSREELDLEDASVEDRKKDTVRGNIYWLSRFKLTSTARIINTLYYQPAVDRADDFRFLALFSLKVAIEKNLDLKLNINAVHDNDPPVDVERTDVNYVTGLEYRF